MPEAITLKPNQRMFVEPRDPSPNSTFANTRLYELLNDLGRAIERQTLTAEVGRTGHSKKRNFYEVTFVSPEQLAIIYKQQQTGSIPIVLWTRFGNGPLRRYAPDKQSLEKLLKSGLITKGKLPVKK